MTKPKVGVSMLYSLGEPFNRMVKHLKNIGTSYIEIVDDGAHELTSKRIKTLKETAKSYNLTYSLHAPFADVNIASPIKSLLNASIKRVKQSIEHANDLGAKLLVFHPGALTGISQFYPGAQWKQNIASIQEIYATAEDYGVNVAIENLPGKYWFLMNSPEQFAKFYRETNLPLGIVMDLGHAHLEGLIKPFFNQLADKIVHIHASDNDGTDDQHNGVGDGNIDYTWLSETLKKIRYDKSVIVESTKKVSESIAKLRQLLD